MKILWSILILIAGVGITLLAIITGPTPKKRPAEEKETYVKAIIAEPISVAPSIIGYGEAQPARTWKAIAQVAGKVTWKSDKLKSGKFFKSGELMLKLDDTETKLKIYSGEADIKKYQAKILELKNTRTNLESQIEVLKKILNFNTRELERQSKLHSIKAVADVTVEEQEIAVLQQRNSIITKESDLRLLPAQIDYQQAQLDAAKATLEQTKLQLDYAKITAPFDCRIDTVNVELMQYVAIGDQMVTADGIDEMEIPVQFSLDQMALLIHSSPSKVRAEAEKAKAENRKPDWTISVKTNGGVNSFHWNARFLRMGSGIDTTTRMVSMVVGVQEPFKRQPGVHQPPLDKGLFCQVKIIGKPLPAQLAVPRSAVHQGNLYIATKDSRLEIRPVKIDYNLEHYAVIASGLKAGETVIVSDLVPAIRGMKLNVNIDGNFVKLAENELVPQTEVIR